MPRQRKPVRTVAQAVRLLTRSGRRSQDQIVEYLRNCGITRHRPGFITRTCPIAQFLRRTVGGEWQVTGRHAQQANGKEVRLPDVVHTVVCDYDYDRRGFTTFPQWAGENPNPIA